MDLTLDDLAIKVLAIDPCKAVYSQAKNLKTDLSSLCGFYVKSYKTKVMLFTRDYKNPILMQQLLVLTGHVKGSKIPSNAYPKTI